MSEQDGTATDKEVELSDEQQDVIDAVLAGKSIFITGAAGVGKSFILKEVIKILPTQSTYVTASTGVAACNINGITFHSFAGIGLGTAPYEELLKRAMKRYNAQKWLKCRALIVDEVSMIDGSLFEKVEQIAREIKGSSLPFGGIQLILCGDFLQLPPVEKQKQAKFCFEVPSWKRCVQRTVLLKKVFRQKDEHLIGILSRVRLGEMSLKDKADLSKCHFTKKVFDDKIHATKLFPHRISCEQVNNAELEALPGKCHIYESTDGGRPEYLEQMDKYSRFPNVLSVKVGAQVMLLKNLSVSVKLVNGSRGVVTAFSSQNDHALEKVHADRREHEKTEVESVNSSRLNDKQYPVVRFANGTEKLITEEISSIEIAGREVAYRKQVPLALAWAVSVHKAQGLTLERVDLSLKRVFECGQAYVALSRCTSLEGLRLDDFSSDKVRAHPKVLAYYKQLEEAIVDIKSNRVDVDRELPSKLSNFANTGLGIEPGHKPAQSGFFSKRTIRQELKKFPGLNKTLTVGNKLFKNSQKATGDTDKAGSKRSVSTNVDFFASKAKHLKMDESCSGRTEGNGKSVCTQSDLFQRKNNENSPLIIID